MDYDRCKTVSVMEAYPEHLRLIGMLNVEISRLELTLGLLLATLTRTPGRIGQTIYLTPHSNIARLHIIRNILPYCFSDPKQKLIGQIERALGRIETTMGKRHAYVHHAYGAVNNSVLKTPLPMRAKDFSKIVEIKDLERIISDVRRFIGLISALTDRVTAAYE